jgi:predicted metal-binding membrane protein
MNEDLERLLRRDRTITLSGLLLLCALAWIYVVFGAGLGMGAWEMSGFSFFPHRTAAEPALAAPDMPVMPDMPDMPGMDMSDMTAMDGMQMSESSAPEPASWSVGGWALIIAMWWVMMIAMMTPSAAPTILLYARVHRHAATQEAAQKLAPTGAFAAGYLMVWLGFAITAAVLHWTLERAGLVTAMMGSESRWLSAGVLIAAGAYQLSPLKGICLAHCRAPASFLSKHWRPGAAGALRLGAMHGAYCVGCCWVLMALLFVGGVMNLIWIAALAVLVLLEKLAPRGEWLGRAAGVALIAWGAATLLS